MKENLESSKVLPELFMVKIGGVILQVILIDVLSVFVLALDYHIWSVFLFLVSINNRSVLVIWSGSIKSCSSLMEDHSI